MLLYSIRVYRAFNTTTASLITTNMGNNNGKPELRQEDIDAMMKSSGMNEAQVDLCLGTFLSTESQDLFR